MENVLHLIEDRRFTISPYGAGNSKLGDNVVTYSRMPGRKQSCPGATDYCESICYAIRLAETTPLVQDMWHHNDIWWRTPELSGMPPLPVGTDLVRMHVGGDFDSSGYIDAWERLARIYADVLFWGYTRSWSVDHLRKALDILRGLPNVELFASVDPDHTDSQLDELQQASWRLSWISNDPRVRRANPRATRRLECLEETGLQPDCRSCGYCFRRNGPGDVIFTEHGPTQEQE